MSTMKIVVFGPDRRVGVLHDDRLVVDISLAYAKLLHERDGEHYAAELAAVLAPPDLARFIERGEATLDAARDSISYLLESAGDRAGPRGEIIIHDLSTVRLHAPRPAAARIACAGGNFADHHLAMAQRRPGGAKEAAALTLEGVAAAIRQAGFWGFWKVDRQSLGPDEPLRYPRRAKLLDYEGELAVILGKRGRDIRAEDWRSHVWGVTLLCDWSIRQAPDSGRLNFAMVKNFDGSSSLGPCILVGDVDPSAIDVTTRVNGELRQSFNTRDMVFSFGECMAFLSRDLTLHPGDIVSGGTAAGTAQDSSEIVGDGVLSTERFLKPGDTVEVASSSIGVLRSRISVAGH
jgi:2-keto-4-pentenoate hydratase/2-oxohepta-3-ene-1,7-dioic acid hydratase in catechol pathway